MAHSIHMDSVYRFISFWNRFPELDGFKVTFSEEFASLPELTEIFASNYPQMKAYLSRSENNQIVFSASKVNFTIKNAALVASSFEEYLMEPEAPNALEGLNKVCSELGMTIRFLHTPVSSDRDKFC